MRKKSFPVQEKQIGVLVPVTGAMNMELAIWYQPVLLCASKCPQVRDWDCHSIWGAWERAGQEGITPVHRRAIAHGTSITNGPPHPL